ncbi:MAG: bifunctional precorrin-2 dehydrogenase/sirohydrochlorin ferrochelatase [Anaerolineae bacterium]
MSGYPIYLSQLHRVLCVVVGGGEVAERKVSSLLEAQAKVQVISPTLTKGLRQLAARGAIDHLARAYRDGDLEGAFLAIAATDDPVTNRAIFQEAEARKILVNVVDEPSLCNFLVPAVVRRGSLIIGISTEGRSPALAARVRQRLESLFGPEYASLLDILGDLREWIIDACPSEKRRDLWYRLVDSDLLELLREGKEQEARERAKVIVATYLEGCL